MYRDNGYEGIFLELQHQQNQYLERIAVALEALSAGKPPAMDRTDLPKPTHW